MLSLWLFSHVKPPQQTQLTASGDAKLERISTDCRSDTERRGQRRAHCLEWVSECVCTKRREEWRGDERGEKKGTFSGAFRQPRWDMEQRRKNEEETWDFAKASRVSSPLSALFSVTPRLPALQTRYQTKLTIPSKVVSLACPHKNKNPSIPEKVGAKYNQDFFFYIGWRPTHWNITGDTTSQLGNVPWARVIYTIHHTVSVTGWRLLFGLWAAPRPGGGPTCDWGGHSGFWKLTV